uniref:DNA-directed DNA polymerase n=1 Tax=Oikopleura dioica TaxID=34765 RepID=Q66S32_OIKDI|nr:hypothetical protein 008-24 [Oikopleura dioica]
MLRVNLACYLGEINPYWIMGLIVSSGKPYDFYINRNNETELRRYWDSQSHRELTIKDIEKLFQVNFCAIKWIRQTKTIAVDDFLYVSKRAVYYEIDVSNMKLWFYPLNADDIPRLIPYNTRFTSPVDFTFRARTFSEYFKLEEKYCVAEFPHPTKFRDLIYLQMIIEKDIELYVLKDEKTLDLLHAAKRKYKSEPLRLLIDDTTFDLDTVIDPILIINNINALPRNHHCPNEGCYFEFSIPSGMERHLKTCSNKVTSVTAKQKSYGLRDDIIMQLVNEQILPKEALSYRIDRFVCFDIETLEKKVDTRTPATELHASHHLLSIAIGTNFGFEKVFVRENSSAEAARQLVQDFVETLVEISDSWHNFFPNYFKEAVEKLENIVAEAKKKTEKRRFKGMLNKLVKHLKMNIYGFNSARFDLPVLVPYLLPIISKYDSKLSVIKKSCSYFLIENRKMAFRDVLNFSVPISLAGYLKQNSTEQTKSIWPYTFYNSVEEIKCSDHFPSHECFYSDLRQSNVSVEEYNENLNLFIQKKMKNPSYSMLDWLKRYNLLDVTPLSHAINTSFSNFHKVFGIDPSSSLSLPGFAQNCMFSLYRKDAPLAYPNLVDSSGHRHTLQHQYFRGEHEENGWKIDGYAEIDGKKIFWEFLGCYYHTSCPSCHPNATDERWERKKAYLQSVGKLISIHECKWNSINKAYKWDSDEFPLIRNTYGKEHEIISGIRSGALFGYVVADVRCPPQLYRKIKDVNFPPVIQRLQVTPEMLSPFMRSKIERENTTLRETVVQTFNGKQQLLLTETVQFYLEKGFIIENITSFLQYRGVKVLEKFVQTITDGRVKAINEKQKELGLAYKTVGNSSYGKLGQKIGQPSAYYGNLEYLARKSKEKNFKFFNTLEQEDGDSEIYEIISSPKNANDNKALPMCVAILQHSKLLFLRFIYDCVFKYFEEGSYKLVYCDTDSIAIATTRTEDSGRTGRRASMEDTFFPIIKKGMLDDFKRIWGNWFVLTDEVRDEKTPGLLKVEWETKKGSMVALACKAYQCQGSTEDDIKRSTKGTPHSHLINQSSFKKALMEELKDEENRVPVRSLGVKNQKIHRFTTTKRMLTSTFYKLQLASDKITTRPLQINGVII